MIEGALVYIFAAVPPNPFVGCGAMIEGGLVATCRHVWRDALAQAPDGAAPLVEFPRAKPAQRRGLALAKSCEGDDPPLDLVLLRPAAIPSGTPVLQLAMKETYEVGEAASRARIRRDSGWIEATVSGRLNSALDPDGQRQFTGENRRGLFFVRGSSGSPVFCRGGQQLAAILSLAELGANEGKSPLQEAFAVPATTIRRFRERMAAQPVAVEEGMDATDLRRLLDAIGAAGIPVQEIPARLRAFVGGARAHAADTPALTNAGGDIAAAIDTARAKLGDMDLAGARATLSAKLAEERRGPRATPAAAVARAGGDRPAQLRWRGFASGPPRDRRADPGGCLGLDRSWGRLADGRQHRASLGRLSAGQGRCGGRRSGTRPRGQPQQDRRRAGGAGRGRGGARGLPGGPGHPRALAGRRPGNAEWQRDLSVSHDRIGDVLRRPGRPRRRAGGLPRGPGHPRERWPPPTPATPSGSATSRSATNRIGDVLRGPGRPAPARSQAYRAGLDIRERAGRRRPRQRRVAARPLGQPEQDRRRARAQGDLAGALEAYRASHDHRRAAGRRRPGQRPVAARPLGQPGTGSATCCVAQGDLAGALAAYRQA